MSFLCGGLNVPGRLVVARVPVEDPRFQGPVTIYKLSFHLSRSSSSFLLHDQTKSSVKLDRPIFARCKYTLYAMLNYQHNFPSLVHPWPHYHHLLDGFTSTGWI